MPQSTASVKKSNHGSQLPCPSSSATLYGFRTACLAGKICRCTALRRWFSDEEDVGRPAAAIERAFAFWHKALPGRGGVAEKAARAVLEALAPTFSLVPSG